MAVPNGAKGGTLMQNRENKQDNRSQDQKQQNSQDQKQQSRNQKENRSK